MQYRFGCPLSNVDEEGRIDLALDFSRQAPNRLIYPLDREQLSRYVVELWVSLKYRVGTEQ